MEFGSATNAFINFVSNGSAYIESYNCSAFGASTFYGSSTLMWSGCTFSSSHDPFWIVINWFINYIEFRENLDTNYSGECSLDSSQSHTVDRMLGVLIIYYD